MLGLVCLMVWLGGVKQIQPFKCSPAGSHSRAPTRSHGHMVTYGSHLPYLLAGLLAATLDADLNSYVSVLLGQYQHLAQP